MSKKLKLTQIRSVIGKDNKHEKVLIGLGLGKIGKVKILNDTPAIRGMFRKVQHLALLEEFN